QPRLANLAQPHPHRIVDRDALDVAGVLVADLEVLEAALAAVLAAGSGLGGGVLDLVHDLDALVGQALQEVFDLLGVDRFRTKGRVDLVVREHALLLPAIEQPADLRILTHLLYSHLNPLPSRGPSRAAGTHA